MPNMKAELLIDRRLGATK